MAVGQAVLPSATLDVAGARRLQDRIEGRERDRSVAHAEQLTDLLALDRLYAKAGMALGTAAEIALLLHCSEDRANSLLVDAKVLARLEALPVMRDGVLTVEQARVVSDVLGPLEDDVLAGSLWERLRTRLQAAAERGEVLPPARLRELLRRWLLSADPKGAVARRKQAQRDTTGVEVWRRDDGLLDLALRGVTGPAGQAILARISDHSDPIGPYDERAEGERRLAAAVDLMLGRVPLRLAVDGDADTAAEAAGGMSRPGCGCGLGAEVPCGAQVFVHVPLPTALDAADEPAELVGHGPIDRDLLDQLLDAAPVLHRVWVQPETGVPVAVDDRTWQPPRRDRDAVRQALLDLASGPPPPAAQRHPVHPDDHDLPDDRPPDSAPPDPARDTSCDAEQPRVLTRPHRADPGGYVPPRRVKRLVRARAPRCEWPGCGRRAIAPRPCDLDHDLAWPYGPTCACNLGPACRRHHRIKQLGWTKQRQRDGSVRWTSPTGRRWTSPAQHPIPRATRPVPTLAPADPLDDLTQYELDQFFAARHPEQLERLDLDAPLPVEPEPTGDVVRTTADLWTLIHDQSAWHDWPEPVEPT